VDPRRRLAEVSDDEALRIVRLAAPLMRESAERGGRVVTAPGGEWDTWVYGHAGRPCRRCGATIESRGQGDDNRTTYWCPGCQA
jgi:endonuclease-8